MENTLTSGQKALARRVRQHVGAAEHEFYAIVHPGFEEIAAAELVGLGLGGLQVAGRGGLAIHGRLETCWRLHLGSRTVSRVLMRLERFRCRDYADLRKRTAGMAWELFLPPDVPLALRMTSHRTRLNHEGRIAAEIREGIGERLASCGRQAAFVETGHEGSGSRQEIFVRIEEDKCQISLDASGELLYRRGLERHVGPAPLRETLAAAILKAARIETYEALIDPLAGSGVFSLEAGLMGQSSLAGAKRDFAFQRWPAHRPAAYNHLMQAMRKEIQPIPLRFIRLSDIDEQVLVAARRNIRTAGLEKRVEIERRDFLLDPTSPPAGLRTLVVINPPYGERLEAGNSIRNFYSRLGGVLRSRFNNCGWAVIVPGLEREKNLAIPHDLKIPFFNGGFPVALLVRHAPGADYSAGA
jgi:putative N6-adenine-specific DNA methylase